MPWPRLGSLFTRASNGRLEVSYDAEARALGALIGLVTRRRPGQTRISETEAAATKAAAYLAILDQAYGPLSREALAQETTPVGAVVLDSSALAALARGDGQARAVLRRALGISARILVPATALLDARLAAVGEAVGTAVPIDASLARDAGAYIARTRVSAPLDALSVALAARQDSACLLTTERAEIVSLARAANHPALYLFTLTS